MRLPDGTTVRRMLERRERESLSPLAAFSDASRGREREEQPCQVRPVFQQDRDRIIHSKAFRRLKYKTQVFLAPRGDHYRTRLTHTLEVAQIARTIARALRLNEDLTEAIAMGHDLGHTPFGHAGEKVLAGLRPGGFHHARQSLRIVELLENDGRGLNLTFETRDGIRRHSKGRGEIGCDNPETCPTTLEGQIVRLADLIAYLNHDIDDALRAGVLAPDDVPSEARRRIGITPSERINRMVIDVIDASDAETRPLIAMSREMHETAWGLRDFLYERVYENIEVHQEFGKASAVLEGLYIHFRRHPESLVHFGHPDAGGSDGREDAICDFLAGMTDRYAIWLFSELFVPKQWNIF